jgi:3-hydroxymyristoyl/3-hydroxydecanoyl-(acyl carrier protein) dehydratase
MTQLQFTFSVPATHPSLAGHFPGQPVVPGVLLLDHVVEALETATGRGVTRLQRVKFLSALAPGEVVQGRWTIDGSQATFRLAVQRSGAEVKVAEGAATLAEAPAP